MKYRSIISLIIALSLGTLQGVCQQSRQDSCGRFDSYKGLVMAGYQGWFNTPGDGANRNWHHYENGRVFRPGACTIDLWPEVSEYPQLYPTEFTFENGDTARVFSSYDASTVDTHFRWMQDYGLDGVFMQRFISEIRNNSGRKHFNKVLESALASAAKYERAIVVMYDLSGMNAGDGALLLKDMKDLCKRFDLQNRKKNPTYLHHNGKPLVTVWGVGFNDRRRYGLEDAKMIVDGLKEMGFSVMLGVPTYWRTFGRDTEKNPELHALIKKCDIVMPWFVGRYNDKSYRQFAPLIAGDIAWAKANGVDYAPLCFPGFSWKNMNGHENSVPIPRNKGNFFWQQLSNCINSGAEMLYIAMFDEIDEGTAIFKCAKRVPVGASRFVPIEDGIESDHYLWLAGQAGKMLRGEIPLQMQQPVRQ